MSLTTNRQQELIEESIASSLRYNDKVSQQYLRLRNDILEFTKKLRVEDETNHEMNRVKVEQYRFELEKVYELYRIHVSSMKRILYIHKNTRRLNLDELPGQLESMEDVKQRLEKNVRTLEEVQRPMLDKMKSLSKNFDSGLRPRSARKVIQKIRKDGDGVSDSASDELDPAIFIFDDAEIHSFFNDGHYADEIDWKQQVDDHVHGRLFRQLEQKYVYDVTRGAGNVAPASTTVDDYDKIIAGLVEEIGLLLAHGQTAKARWTENAEKVDKFRARE